MGRNKIELKRIECDKERASKYSKRKKGLLKKADEISKLCDVEVALLSFSPTSKADVFTPLSRPLSRILERFSKILSRDREERRAYTIKTLKKMYKNDTETSSEDQLVASERDDEEVFEDDDKTNELRNLKIELDEKTSMLRDWQKPHRVNDLERLNIMGKYLVSALNLAKNKKIKLQEDEESVIN